MTQTPLDRSLSADLTPTEELPPLLRDLIVYAAQARATDIHLDAWQHGASVRLRIDGKIHSRESLDPQQTRRLIKQVQVAAGLDIDSAFEAQEGHLRWRGPDRTIDLRVTDTPTAPHHRAVHMRLLATAEDVRAAEHLGLRDGLLAEVKRHLGRGQGLTLIAGPTGAGKTTTLYALIGAEDLSKRIAINIEEPAEIDLPFVRQIEVDERVGRDMAEGLKLALRMDPDIIGVGEVRDQPSAQIAVRAALSGRGVLATIHGHDAASAINALHFLGVPYSVLAGGLRMVIAQDLVRLLCGNCRRHRPVDDRSRKLFEKHGIKVPQQVFDPVGCPQCEDIGYRGRIGVFQVATLDTDVLTKLSTGLREPEIRQMLRDHGVPDIAADALGKVGEGLTSMTEVTHLLSETTC